MIGGAGSANAMRDIKSGDSVLKATVIYPSTQAADGIKLARLLVQGKALERPGRGRGAAHGAALRAGRDRGQRRPVHRHRVRVLTAGPGPGRPRPVGRAHPSSPAHRPPGSSERSIPSMTSTNAPPSRWAWWATPSWAAAHSQAWRTAPRFFDLPLDPGHAGRLRPRRRPGRRGGRAARLGRVGDRLAAAGRAPRHRPRRHLHPRQHPRRDRDRRARGRQARALREAAGQHAWPRPRR